MIQTTKAASSVVLSPTVGQRPGLNSSWLVGPFFAMTGSLRTRQMQAVRCPRDRSANRVGDSQDDFALRPPACRYRRTIGCGTSCGSRFEKRCHYSCDHSTCKNGRERSRRRRNGEQVTGRRKAGSTQANSGIRPMGVIEVVVNGRYLAACFRRRVVFALLRMQLADCSTHFLWITFRHSCPTAETTAGTTELPNCL